MARAMKPTQTGPCRASPEDGPVLSTSTRVAPPSAGESAVELPNTVASSPVTLPAALASRFGGNSAVPVLDGAAPLPVLLGRVRLGAAAGLRADAGHPQAALGGARWASDVEAQKRPEPGCAGALPVLLGRTSAQPPSALAPRAQPCRERHPASPHAAAREAKAAFLAKRDRILGRYEAFQV